jgi:hypothetical protein
MAPAAGCAVVRRCGVAICGPLTGRPTVGRALAWAGIISCVFWGFWMRTGIAWLPCVVVGGLCVAYLIYAGRRDKRRTTVLPSSIARLAYYSDDTAVAFAWQWRKGRDGRLRILRSDTRSAQSPDDETGGQTCVFDGSDDKFIDGDIQPRRTYHYSLFAADGNGGWSDPICQPVMTYPAAERAAIEATYKGASPGSPYAPGTFHGVGGTTLAASQAIGVGLGGVATDLIFSVASVFAADKTADGWEEIS